jgi:hypothetical protein
MNESRVKALLFLYKNRRVMTMKLIELTDELLEKLARYYAHPLMKELNPYLVELTFDQFVQREVQRMMHERENLTPVGVCGDSI